MYRLAVHSEDIEQLSVDGGQRHEFARDDDAGLRDNFTLTRYFELDTAVARIMDDKAVTALRSMLSKRWKGCPRMAGNMSQVLKPDEDVSVVFRGFAGIGYAYLNGGSLAIDKSQVAETYYRWQLGKVLGLTADVQYQQDDYKTGGGPSGWMFGLRAVAEF